MIILETSFLVDYLDGAEAVQTFLEENQAKPFFSPALALFEVYRGAGQVEGRAGVNRLQKALDWIKPLPLTAETAREAAVIEFELQDTGASINLGDVLIAGICRHHGGDLVTRDEHFERVPDLQIVSY